MSFIENIGRNAFKIITKLEDDFEKEQRAARDSIESSRKDFEKWKNLGTVKWNPNKNKPS
ncbi:hypothetical protein [Selenomonas sp. AE3005]|uniref:hypothetical protein n=1 Tax=Selenomonas sp. AE3005 TaxID=1485543 RepID=UPI0025DD45FE|nr:hypothetical protein [Selenomonas sp. AE3005]